jgi:hypothetical protein
MVARLRFRVAIGAVGLGLAVVAVPVATADPAAPADSAAVPAALAPAPAPAADPAPITDAALAPVPSADPAGAGTPANGVQHLPSPDSLPPGTTQEAPAHPTTGLLRDIWHALRDGEMSGPDALKLLATRPVDPEKLAGSKPSNQVGPAAPAGTDVPPAPAPDAAPAPAAPTPVPAS